MLDEAAEKPAEEPAPEDELPANSLRGPAVSRAGDLWVLGPHRLLCGDPGDPTSYQILLEGKQADLVLSHPRFNIATEGGCSGLARGGEADAATASGEISEEQFIALAKAFLQRSRENTKDGAVLFVFTDWQHLYGLMTASREVGLALKNLVVWAKDSAAIGSFYRSGHELVLVLKNGDAPHTNSLELGRHGRYRTNIWEYAGVTSLRAARTEDLALHPTVKPTALVADAIRDVTRRGAIVLDPFAGHGTTIIAAEKTGRHGQAIELDPLYCDVIIRRRQQYTGKAARLEGSDLTFEDVEPGALLGKARPPPRAEGGQ
jgi:DNA modification methylase